MGYLEQIKQWTIEQVLWAETELHGKSGADKKAAVVKKLDDMIKLPSYLEWVDDMIISYLVDQACAKLNEMSEHNFKNYFITPETKAKIASEMEVQR